jgi:hypothetical protein
MFLGREPSVILVKIEHKEGIGLEELTRMRSAKVSNHQQSAAAYAGSRGPVRKVFQLTIERVRKQQAGSSLAKTHGGTFSRAARKRRLGRSRDLYGVRILFKPWYLYATFALCSRQRNG